jgi:twitching motility protein PilT
MTGRVAERISEGSRTSEIHEVIQEGSFYGMQTFDQSLLELVRAGWVGVEQAFEASTAPHDLKLMLEQAQLIAAGTGPVT